MSWLLRACARCACLYASMSQMHEWWYFVVTVQRVSSSRSFLQKYVGWYFDVQTYGKDFGVSLFGGLIAKVAASCCLWNTPPPQNASAGNAKDHAAGMTATWALRTRAMQRQAPHAYGGLKDHGNHQHASKARLLICLAYTEYLETHRIYTHPVPRFPVFASPFISILSSLARL